MNFDLSAISKQFLNTYQLKTSLLEPLIDDDRVQLQVIEHTTSLNIVLDYPLNLNYQKAFVKRLIDYLERQGSVVIHDRLYEEYGRLVALPSTGPDYFKYYLVDGPAKIIILKENVNLISKGTTGLRTWQAALALSEYITQNSKLFENKVVLELGSGVGLTGLTLCVCCSPAGVFFTDCHTSVLTCLCDNIKINISRLFSSSEGEDNNIEQQLGTRCLFKQQIRDKSCLVQVLRLPWEEVDRELCQQLGQVDKIIAADVVYDESLFLPLIGAIGWFFRGGLEEFILSCTERNEATLAAFLSLIGEKLDVQIDLVEVPEPRKFLWDTDVPVKIFSITPQTKWFSHLVVILQSFTTRWLKLQQAESRNWKLLIKRREGPGKNDFQSDCSYFWSQRFCTSVINTKFNFIDLQF